MATTTEVENYPGFPEGIQGPELNARFQAQAEKFGTAVEIDYVTDLDVAGPYFRVGTASGKRYQAKSLILATGASARKLDVSGEARLTGRGVSYCGTCDGFFFRGKEVVVVGGGDSALEEALFLSRNLPAEGIRLVQRMEADLATHMVALVWLEIHLPAGFPERYKDALIRSAEQCAVKKHLERPPAITVSTVLEAVAVA